MQRRCNQIISTVGLNKGIHGLEAGCRLQPHYLAISMYSIASTKRRGKKMYTTTHSVDPNKAGKMPEWTQYPRRKRPRSTKSASSAFFWVPLLLVLMGALPLARVAHAQDTTGVPALLAAQSLTGAAVEGLAPGQEETTPPTESPTPPQIVYDFGNIPHLSLIHI